MNLQKSTLSLMIIGVIAACLSVIPVYGTIGAPPNPEVSPLQVDTTIYLPFVNQSAAIPVTPGPTPAPTATPEPPSPPPPGSGSWPMVAANVERTSWTDEEVSGDLHIEWYRPVEAYISPKIQIIAEYGMLYVATSRGLYALNAANGETVWRFDTQMPLGNSPTVADGVVYVGGYDRKIHALDAYNGAELWNFSGALAGYDANPLVVNGKVITGNRDGSIYAIGAHGTTNQGQLIWEYRTGGSIHLSAAYKDGVVYFASNDNYAYALSENTGTLIWKSAKLPGDGYQSYWPTVFRDKVIFSGAYSYRAGVNPGTTSVTDGDSYSYGSMIDIQREGIWPGEPNGTLIGDTLPENLWWNGYPLFDATRITEYQENNPQYDTYKHKPWRRVAIALSRADGSEYTFDSDQDGYAEYIPIVYWGTHSGNRYPPLVGPDNILYFGNIYQRSGISRGRVMGWQPSYPSYLSVLYGQGATDEPYSISAGGNLIYRVSGDDIADYFDIGDPYNTGSLWDYDDLLYDLAPGYEEMIFYNGYESDHWYGVYGSPNGIYHPRGDENPLIPYAGNLYIHRGNTILAFGTGSSLGKLPTIPINDVQEDSGAPTQAALISQLEQEIQKIIDSGHLRPGYINNGQFSPYADLSNYFENPGDTLYTLAVAYPHLSSNLRQATKQYLHNEFLSYFDPVMYSTIGWADGGARESMPIPPEVEIAMNDLPPTLASPVFYWTYPPYNIYAMWKYAQIFPEDVNRIYHLAKSKLQVPVRESVSDALLAERPWIINSYLAGYVGFLRLQEQAGQTEVDSQIRTSVLNEINRLSQLLINTFDKDTPWGGEGSDVHLRHLNIARNFIMLVPDVGEILRDNNLAEVQAAVDEYNAIAPYWFVSRYEAVHDEGVISNLYNYHAVFLAKAFILQESRTELYRYLDVPAFERGDLFYIQNLVAVIEAP